MLVSMPVSMSYCCRAVMSAKDLFPYRRCKERFGSARKTKFFNCALKEIVTNPKVGYGERGMTFESDEEEETNGQQVII